MTFDLLIRNGAIVDGLGGEPYVGDVAIADGVIAAVGRVDGDAVREVDATGLLVTPGFVDLHTHYDGQAIWSDRMRPSSAHGVTTAVMGNCGVGFAPCRAADHDVLVDVMAGVEDIPGVVMVDGLAWDWETFPEYLDALDARKRDIDVAAYLPHSPLRVYVMGQRGADREPATAEDLARMRALASEAIEVGALGFASSRFVIHKTESGAQIPSYDAAQDEIAAIANGVADAGGGLIQFVPDIPAGGYESVLRQVFEAAADAGLPVTFSLLTGNSGDPLWPEALTLVEKFNAAGSDITVQMFPRPIGLVIGLELTANPFVLYPTYREIAHLPLPERVQRVVGCRADTVFVVVVQEFRLVGGHVDPDGAVAGAGFAGQAQIEGIPNCFGSPAVGDHLAAQHFLQGTGSSAGRVVFVVGGTIARTHHAAGVAAATADADAARHCVEEAVRVMGVAECVRFGPDGWKGQGREVFGERLRIDDDSRVEDVGRVEESLHRGKEPEHAVAVHDGQQFAARAPIAVLTRERSAVLRHEVGGVGDEAVHVGDACRNCQASDLASAVSGFPPDIGEAIADRLPVHLDVNLDVSRRRCLQLVLLSRGGDLHTGGAVERTLDGSGSQVDREDIAAGHWAGSSPGPPAQTITTGTSPTLLIWCGTAGGILSASPASNSNAVAPVVTTAEPAAQ